MISQRHINKCAGFSLLEILITIFILAIGLLGLAALQMNSLKNNHSAQHRTSAVVLAYDIVDRMRLNKGTLKAADLTEWKNDLSSSIPSGDGSVAIDAGNIVTVVVQWDDSRATSGTTTQSFSVDTEL